MHGHDNHLSNLLEVGRHVLPGLDNCCFLRNLHGLHGLGVLAMVWYCITGAWPASSSASAAVMHPTAAYYSVPQLPHVHVAPKQSRDNQSGLALAVISPVALPPHYALCSHGVFLHASR